MPIERSSAIAFAMLLLTTGCDNLSSSGRQQRSGPVRMRGGANAVTNETSLSPEIGAPMAWRVESESASYGSAGQDPLFALRCDRSHHAVILERAGGVATFGLQVEGEDVLLETHAVAHGRLQSQLPLNSVVLARLVAPQSSIILKSTTESRVIPTGIAVRRVVEHCQAPLEAPAAGLPVPGSSEAVNAALPVQGSSALAPADPASGNQPR